MTGANLFFYVAGFLTMPLYRVVKALIVMTGEAKEYRHRYLEDDR